MFLRNCVNYGYFNYLYPLNPKLYSKRFRSKFLEYKGYANASIDKMFTKDEMKGAIQYQANYWIIMGDIA